MPEAGGGDKSKAVSSGGFLEDFLEDFLGFLEDFRGFSKNICFLEDCLDCLVVFGGCCLLCKGFC